MKTADWRAVRGVILVCPAAVHTTQHCKNFRISTDIWWRVFHILTEPVPYTSVSVNGRNNEALAHIAMWARASLFGPFTDTDVYGTGAVKIWKTRHQISVDIRIFFCVEACTRCHSTAAVQSTCDWQPAGSRVDQRTGCPQLQLCCCCCCWWCCIITWRLADCQFVDDRPSKVGTLNMYCMYVVTLTL